MSEWSDGYVTDIGYTFGYYQELNPTRARWALLSNGWAEPDINTACELGFGQGVSINLHAAASATEWFGTDFNPSQVAFARSLSHVAGVQVSLYDQTFEAFCARTDLPDFDFVGLHGIWSWISDHNRQVISDFLRRKLRVGGVAFISYNTLPGWASFAPMRHILSQHSQIMSAPGYNMQNRVESALAFAQNLVDAEPQFVKALPNLQARLQRVSKQSRAYLAHEYFNRDWAPMYFSDMAECLAEAKMSFACSAHFLDHVDPLNLTEKQRNVLKDIPDVGFRETVRDFMLNQQFRRDYWVKGPVRLSANERIKRLRQQSVLLFSSRPDITLKVTGSIGEAEMNHGVYIPILDALAGLNGPLSVEALEHMLATPGRLTFEQIVQAITVLVGAGHVQLVNDPVAAPTLQMQARRLNEHLCGMAADGTDISFLSSPLTGGGVSVNRFEQLFLAAFYSGVTSPEEWGASAWRLLEQRGERVLVDGKPLDLPDENLKEMQRRAHVFAEKRLPALRAAGLV